VDFLDPESGELVTVDTSSAVFQKEYAKSIHDIRERRQSELRRAQVDTIWIGDDKDDQEDLVDPLLAFFRRRSRR
jgi:hypothetical protein